MMDKLFKISCVAFLVILTSAAWAGETVIDQFEAGSLDGAWVASEANWHSGSGDTSFNVTDQVGELSGRSSSTGGTYNSGYLVRADVSVAVGQSLQVKYRIVDPAGPGSENNSFIGIVIGAFDNSGGEFGADRHADSNVEFTLDARGRRTFATANKTGGGQQSGAEEIVNDPGGLSYDNIVTGIHMAIYRASATSIQYYIALPGEAYQQVGAAMTIDPGQMDAGFGGAAGILCEWTADFDNTNVQAVFDNMLVVDGEPGETLVPVELSEFLLD